MRPEGLEPPRVAPQDRKSAPAPAPPTRTAQRRASRSSLEQRVRSQSTRLSHRSLDTLRAAQTRLVSRAGDQMRQAIFSRTVVAAVASIGLSQPPPERGINPGPRQGHCLVYDGTLRRVVLLGGYQLSNQPALEEVWSFDGAAWGRLPGAGPAARSLCGAAYDSRRDRVILFGGVGSKGYSEPKSDTWEWDGETWRQATDTTVGTRDHHVMAYDSRRGRTVMYGGLTSHRSWATDT